MTQLALAALTGKKKEVIQLLQNGTNVDELHDQDEWVRLLQKFCTKTHMTFTLV